MSATSPPNAMKWLAELGPAIVAASAFAFSNVLSKVVLASGSDVLTLSLFRGLVGVPLLFLWLRIGEPRKPHSPQARLISLGLGVLFAGVVFGLFAAFAALPIPVAILSYFVYPLLTGMFGALLGIERVTWRGGLAALAALLGLALALRAQPQQIALAGLGFAFGAAACRTAILLITRAKLQDVDPQITTWYTMLGSTAVLALAALVTWNWQGPQTALGWAAMIGVSIGTTIAVLSLFVSIKRIGPFRSALLMNLEPLLTTIFSAPVLGEILTPLQGLGGAILLAALVLFQLRR